MIHEIPAARHAGADSSVLPWCFRQRTGMRRNYLIRFEGYDRSRDHGALIWARQVATEISSRSAQARDPQYLFSSFFDPQPDPRLPLCHLFIVLSLYSSRHKRTNAAQRSIRSGDRPSCIRT